MEKQDNFQHNFSLKGYTSIQIGLYFLLATFIIKKMLEGFLIDDHPMGMLSAELIEFLILTIIFITLLFSSLALFFKGRRKAKKLNYKLWNAKTKTSFWKFLICHLIIFVILILIVVNNYLDYLAPVFLILYALSLLLLKIKKSKNLFVLAGLSVMLAVICFLIPNYWYSSLFILGLAHVTYGIVVKN